jgi:hypothetical protein
MGEDNINIIHLEARETLFGAFDDTVQLFHLQWQAFSTKKENSLLATESSIIRAALPVTAHTPEDLGGDNQVCPAKA